jgi:hypothetical protein
MYFICVVEKYILHLLRVCYHINEMMAILTYNWDHLVHVWNLLHASHLGRLEDDA